ncbi:hypothetical protein RQP46_005428 [Phenoliferia psychrophenolica]
MSTCSICPAPSVAKCGGCKTHPYCGLEHQRQDWKAHRTVCAGRRVDPTPPRPETDFPAPPSSAPPPPPRGGAPFLSPGENQVAAWQRSGTPADPRVVANVTLWDKMSGRIRFRKIQPGPPPHCDGCGVNAREYGASDGEYVLGQCQDCGFKACDACIVVADKGVCWPLCIMTPASYHGARSGQRYSGDRHPPLHGSDDFKPAHFEAKTRKCNTCGKKSRMWPPPKDGKTAKMLREGLRR